MIRSLLGLGSLQHGLLLLCFQLLEAVGLLGGLLFFNALLRGLLRLQTLCLLLFGALHAALGKCLIPNELAIHARHRHLPGPASLLDAIAVILVDLLGIGVVLGL